MKNLHLIAFILLVVGGLNWGLEVFNFGIGSWGLPGALVTIVYALVGISAIYEIATHKTNCKTCGASMGGSM